MLSKNIFLLMLLFILCQSCISPKKVLYMQDLDSSSIRTINQQYTTKLQPDDVLNIVISSKDNLGVAPFNIVTTPTAIGNSNLNGQPKLLNYIIRQDGTIEFPVLGKLKISGMTILETIEFLKQQLKPYLNEPVVVVEWLNFKFTVLGEVKQPGLYRSVNERVSILDALGMAGDLTIYGNRDNIILVREKDGKQETHKIDITSKKFLESDLFYIKQNDVLVVSPNKAQIQSAAFNRNTSIFVSIASLIATTITSMIVLIKK